jgi:hypothetical protein
VVSGGWDSAGGVTRQNEPKGRRAIEVWTHAAAVSARDRPRNEQAQPESIAATRVVTAWAEWLK